MNSKELRRLADKAASMIEEENNQEAALGIISAMLVTLMRHEADKVDAAAVVGHQTLDGG